MKKINLSKIYLNKIIKESINNLLIENIPNNKLYHQTKVDFDILKSIIKNGLQPNDNGEAYGIWFQSGSPFYGINTNIFSIENTQENIDKYKFSKIYDGDIKIATKPIPFNELNVENISFAVSNDKNILFTKQFSNPNSFFQKRFNEYGSVARYLCENKSFNKLLIYTDLFEMFIEQGTSHIFDEYDHIITKKLLD